MQVAFRSDAGKRRKENEDSVLVDGKRNIFILADGMGGYRAGEMASRMAAEVAYDHVVQALDDAGEGLDIPGTLSGAIMKAHQVIKMSTQGNPALVGMGTTMILLMITGKRACICHVGDSRAYLIRDNARRLTQDQTWGDFLVAQEKRQPDEVPEKMWHALTQAVGISDAVEPEIRWVTLAPEDVLLLCSDGLTDMVDDGGIAEIVLARKGKPLEQIADELVDAANEGGGRDNVSVLLVRYEDDGRFFWRTPFSFE